MQSALPDPARSPHIFTGSSLDGGAGRFWKRSGLEVFCVSLDPSWRNIPITLIDSKKGEQPAQACVMSVSVEKLFSSRNHRQFVRKWLIVRLRNRGQLHEITVLVPVSTGTSILNSEPLSNDSQRHNSNSVLHRSCPRLHEITHPHTLSLRFTASRHSVSPLPPDTFVLSPPRLTSAIESSSQRCASCCCTAFTPPANFCTPRSLHTICIRPASAAPAASF
jgi:hypothetical protein